MQSNRLRTCPGRQVSCQRESRRWCYRRCCSCHIICCQICNPSWRCRFTLWIPSCCRWSRINTKTTMPRSRWYSSILLRCCPEILERWNQAYSWILPTRYRCTYLLILSTTCRRCHSWASRRDLEIPMHLWCSEARCRCHRRSRRQLHDGLRGLVSTEVRSLKDLNSTLRASIDIL